MRAPDGFPTRALHGFMRILLNLQRDHKPDYVAVIFDNGLSFRNQLYPDYKGQRPDMPDDLRRQWPELIPLAQAFGFTVINDPNTEADDIIGTLAVKYASPDLDVLIVSGDKDFCQLVNEHIHILDLMKGQELGPAEVAAKWGVAPNQILDLLSLMGDASDNVPGVSGVGEKKAAQFIQRFGSMEAVLANHAAIGGKTGQAIAESVDKVHLARQLITIKLDMPVHHSLDDLRIGERQIDTLREKLSRYNLKSLLSELKLDAPVATDATTSVGLSPFCWGPGPVGGVIAAIRAAGRCAIQLTTTPTGALAELRLAWAPGQSARIPLDQQHRALLAPLLSDPNIGKIAHDARPLFRHLPELAGMVGDTLLGDFVLDPERKHTLDVQCTRIGFRLTGAPGEEPQLVLRVDEEQQKELQKAGLLEVYQRFELPLIAVLADMERAGIGVDVEALHALSLELDGRIQGMMANIYQLAGGEFNVNSTQQLAHILYEKLGLKGEKKTKFGYSTDAETLEKLGHPLADAILAYRELAKLKSTYVDALPRTVDPRDGRIHTTFHQAVAATGRLSSQDPNLQNIPIRSDEGRRIRACFHARPGHVFVSADYSQIELRILAHFCGEGPLVESFLSDQDIHRRTAAEIFGVMPGFVTPAMRDTAKRINFGIIYGMGAHRLANDLKISRTEAQKFIDSYFQRYPQVRAYMDQAIHDARAVGYSTTLYGHHRPVAGITASNPNDRAAAERVAINTPIQGTAAELIKLAMIEVHRQLRGTSAVLILQVHDELLLEVPHADAPAVGQQVRAIMESVETLKVPLKVDVRMGATWDAAH